MADNKTDITLTDEQCERILDAIMNFPHDAASEEEAATNPEFAEFQWMYDSCPLFRTLCRGDIILPGQDDMIVAWCEKLQDGCPNKTITTPGFECGCDYMDMCDTARCIMGIMDLMYAVECIEDYPVRRLREAVAVHYA